MPQRINPINLLIVDDNKLIVDAVQKVLQELCYVHVIGSCSDGDEVLPFIKEHQTDVIFMDIVMKNMDGFEALKVVKNYNNSIKVIGFSLINHSHCIDKFKSFGADGYLSKYDINKQTMELELNNALNRL
jgi:DNA-binding NarL/FixJ family response regulator